MIDPKFNEIPSNAAVLTEEEEAKARRTIPSKGLSINDTIARDANLSVGARGVDTSGVSSGAGAGAGSTSVTPSDEGSPAPQIVPGGGGTGTTPLGDAASGKTSTDRTK